MISPSLLFEDVSTAETLEAWRAAARDVRDAWEDYLAADRPSARRMTFAAYVAALDREAETANELSAIVGSV